MLGNTRPLKARAAAADAHQKVDNLRNCFAAPTGTADDDESGGQE
jgi:hypothetical protein